MSATQAWLEDLSEDWVSQPNCPSEPQESLSPIPARHDSESDASRHRSRIPLMRNSPAPLRTEKNTPRKEAKSHGPSKRRTPLAERSLSIDNVLSESPASEIQVKHELKESLRSRSTASIRSMAYGGTVDKRGAQLPQPKRGQGTLEWKKRLLRGQMGYGDQRDLFSPMGLENIFQKPSDTVAKSSADREPGRLIRSNYQDISSSPPPRPSTKVDKSESQLHRTSHAPSVQDANCSIFSSKSQEGSGVGVSRVISGQTELHNEEFSPVFVSKNNTVDGQIDYAALDMPRSELVQRLKGLEVHEDAGDRDFTSNDSANDFIDSSSFSKIPSETLPEDLPAGTPDGLDMGNYVTTKRGGYSTDDSFQHRPLSPSPLSNTVTNVESAEEATLDAEHAIDTIESDQDGHAALPEAPTPPVFATPTRVRTSSRLSPERYKQKSSPLKLFADNDTYTKQQLQRRLSQFREDESENDPYIDSDGAEPRESMNAGFGSGSVSSVAFSSNDTVVRPSQTHNKNTSRAISQGSAFGHGDLDGFTFDVEHSADSNRESPEDSERSHYSSPPANLFSPGAIPDFRFQRVWSNSSDGNLRPKRKSSVAFSSISHVSKIKGRNATAEKSKDAIKAGTAELKGGKRPPNSPAKESNSKRRRTLLANEFVGVPDHPAGDAKDKNQVMRSVIGRKRKDARNEVSSNFIDPEVLARRHILRPRNPTPSQRRREQIEAEVMEATEEFMLSSPRLYSVEEQLESPAPQEIQAKAVATEVAAFTMKADRGGRDETRKRSVTTQDFLDEALKIMEFIRTKGRPASGLGSLEESGLESDMGRRNDTADHSIALTFSRPPSREGAPSRWQDRREVTHAPQVENHLRKFQEQGDEFMASSLRSLNINKTSNAVPPIVDEVSIEGEGIRIRHAADHGRRSADEDKLDSQNSSLPTRRENDTKRTHESEDSLGRTIATSASHKSDNVATLAPNKVAHLIPDEVAGMTYDPNQKAWVRTKSPSKEHKVQGDLSVNDSEEDPLQHIPDLTVDELREITRLASPSKPEQKPRDVTANAQRPQTRDGQGMPAVASSSVPSKMSQFAWSGHKTETRATSWSEQEASTSKGTAQLPPKETSKTSESEDVEHEYSILEGRDNIPPSRVSGRVRDVTISLSNPAYTRLQATKPPDSSTVSQKVTETNSRPGQGQEQQRRSELGEDDGTLPRRTNDSDESPGDVLIESAFASGRRYTELGQQSASAKLTLSLSLAHVNNENDAYLHAMPANFQPMPGYSDVTLLMSDLPEFTIDQIDEREISDRIVLRQTNGTVSSALEDRYMVGTAELVKVLQDAEAEEPYWEDIRELNISGRGLSNLHRLDAFCWRIEALDVSQNQLQQLIGVPSTVRRLNVSRNLISSLSSWAHLTNLQYLDVSGNDIDNLKGFSEMVHLRELIANDNSIHDLDGVLGLDGLIKLSLRGNKLRLIDLLGSDLYVYCCYSHATMLMYLIIDASWKSSTLAGTILLIFTISSTCLG